MRRNRNPVDIYSRPFFPAKNLMFNMRPQLLCFLLLLFFSNLSIASDLPLGEKLSKTEIATKGTPDENGYTKKDASDNRLNKADAFHIVLSNSLNSSADWIDSFFGEERSEIESDNSNLRLKFSGFLESGKNIDFKVRARLHLVLPNLENKLHIFASSILDGDERDIDYFDPGYEEDTRTRNFYLSLRYFFKAAERRSLSLRAGLKFHTMTPALFAGPRYRYSRGWNTWNFRFVEEFLYFTDIGWESKTSLDFEIPLSKSLIYRINLGGEWREDERGYLYRMDYDLYHTLSERKAMKYQVRYVFNTYPRNHLEYALAGVRYRQQFWRKWLFFEITPQFAFRLEEDYDPKPGITLSLEVLLGKEYMDHTVRRLE